MQPRSPPACGRVSTESRCRREACPPRSRKRNSRRLESKTQPDGDEFTGRGVIAIGISYRRRIPIARHKGQAAAIGSKHDQSRKDPKTHSEHCHGTREFRVVESTIDPSGAGDASIVVPQEPIVEKLRRRPTRRSRKVTLPWASVRGMSPEAANPRQLSEVGRRWAHEGRLVANASQRTRDEEARAGWEQPPTREPSNPLHETNCPHVRPTAVQGEATHDDGRKPERERTASRTSRGSPRRDQALVGSRIRRSTAPLQRVPQPGESPQQPPTSHTDANETDGNSQPARASANRSCG